MVDRAIRLPGRRLRRILVAVAISAAAGTGAAWGSGAFRIHSDHAVGVRFGSRVSVFQRAGAHSVRLPAAALRSRLVQNFRVDLGRVQLVSSGVHRRVFLAPGSNGSLCLFLDEGDQGTTTECAGRDLLLRDGAMYITEPQSDGSFDLVAAVPDGVTAVRAGSGLAAAAQNNVVVLNHVTSQQITLVGSTGTATLDLGPQSPPSTG